MVPRRFRPVPRLCVLLTDGGVVPHDHCLRQVGANRTDAGVGVVGDEALVEIKVSECIEVPGKEVINGRRVLLLVHSNPFTAIRFRTKCFMEVIAWTPSLFGRRASIMELSLYRLRQYSMLEC